ncbi:MAG: GNAT family N-acetyltransferase [Actinomycetota bacterium]
MSDDIEIVTITEDNTSVLDALAEDVFDEPIRSELLRTYLASELNVLLVAVDTTMEPPTVVGHCSAVLHTRPEKPTELFLSELGTTPTHRRRGIARRLVNETLAAGRARGCQSAWIATEPENEPARRLYEAMGDVELAVIYEFEV